MSDTNIQYLTDQFASDSISFTKNNDFTAVKISNQHADAELLLYGAHILSFTPKGSRDILMVSSKSDMSVGKPIRGGIPVCWPWFGPAGDPMHGTARITEWTLQEARRENDGSDTFVLSLDCREQYGLTVKAVINISSSLSFDLTTENVGTAEFELSSALHTYFSISEIESIKILGLANSEYTDKVAGGTRAFNSGDLVFKGFTDSVFDQSSATIQIEDPNWGRTIEIRKEGSNSTVVWNPWIERSKAMPDFADDEYHSMVCVEAGNVGADTRVLKPGESHTLSMKISEK